MVARVKGIRCFQNHSPFLGARALGSGVGPDLQFAGRVERILRGIPGLKG